MRPNQLVSVYLNENLAPPSGGGGSTVLIEEVKSTITSVPVTGGTCVVNSATAFDVTVDNQSKVSHTVTFRLLITSSSSGDNTAQFPAPLGLPFIIGTNDGTVYYGQGHSGTAGDVKTADMTLVGIPDLLTQGFNVVFHNVTAGQTYEFVFHMAFVN